MQVFKSEISFTTNGGDLCFIVALKRTTHDLHKTFVFETVCINNRVYIVTGVERLTHAPPWHAGEFIALRVKLRAEG